jgi:hypothetical protein
METEEALRRDAHKWEPCTKSSIRVRATSLDDPVFDIHYSARRGGMTGRLRAANPVRAGRDRRQRFAGPVQRDCAALPHDAGAAATRDPDPDPFVAKLAMRRTRGLPIRHRDH